ncbi:BhlA/UviB family holin-like peptide [Candidatus Merdisoma sp. JLR.KK006]|uniref:BhlA/UviB family holin-like peptide n=1 Tax=Candidatus Merdisoma sp. JLR.KK006 TaxID=3112626 RepID=UPI002FEF81C8
MESMLMESAMSQGIWVLLFVSLFIYTIKRYEKMESRQEEREREYQELIRGLTDKLSIVANIKEDIEEIKNKLNV